MHFAGLTGMVSVFHFLLSLVPAIPTKPHLLPRAEYCDINGQELCTGINGYSICWRGILDYESCPDERPICRQVESGRIECVGGVGVVFTVDKLV
jgi:hypothetical protein